MRNTALVLVLVAACGGGHGKKDGGTGHDDAPKVYMDAPGPDAPALMACTPKNGTTVSTRLIGQVSGSAVLATSPPNDGRLFVIEQAGRIRIFENEQLRPTPYLDWSSHIVGGDGASGSEQGLLGLAFHPNFAYNGQFFIYYTKSGADVVAKCSASADPYVANPTCDDILSIADPYSNHNGGMLEFGPKDGYLYIGDGDGGSAGDPQRTAQDTNKLLGKILRIDVNSEANGKKYAIPADNPFATSGGAPEVYIYGLRNPWRWSFDKATGDLWIGDVGQDAYEELDVLKYGNQAGKNLGWSKFEGNHCYASNYTPCADTDVNTNGFTGPVYERTHQSGWISVIGGAVYSGSCFPDLQGKYFFIDYGAHQLMSATLNGDGTVAVTGLTGTWPQSPSSLHSDARGELYLTTTAGRVYQIEAGP